MPSNTVKFSPEKPAPGKRPPEKRGHGLGITIFSAIILVVIVVTFIGAPVVSKVSEQSAVNFGSYDGIPIEFIQGNLFSQQVEQLNRFYEQFNQGTSNVEFQRQLVWRQAFEQTATQIGLKREAERAGIVITDGQIDKALVNHSAYQKDGKFSEELYRQTASADRFKYRQETKTSLLVQQYANDRSQGALVSKATEDFVAGMAYPQRKFSFVTFTDADYPLNLVSDYAGKNKALFRTVDLSRITVTSSEGDAQKVREEAVKGEKAFSDLAKTYSKDALADSGGALNVRHYYELKSEITKSEDLDKVFALAKGGISAVLKNDKGWTIYKVNTAATDADLASADTLAVVRSYIARNDRGLLEDNLEAQAKAFAETAKTDFAAAAKKLGKSVAVSGWVALNFGNHDLFPSITEASKDTTFSGLASNEDFFKKAFRVPVGQIAAPVLASPAVLVLKVDAIKTAPAAGETAISASAVQSTINSERSKEVQQAILTSPKFKDQFQSEFDRLFRAQ
jgi:hypothetical protein